MTQNGRVRPEAELETLLTAALALAFPGIPRSGFTNQTRFKVRMGHDEHDVDGMRHWESAGRADIIISKDGRPLAVVEVKRENIRLTDDDRKQGLSYATAQTPRPPLVIVTNGGTTQFFDSSTGEPWHPEGEGAGTIAKLFENASRLAAASLSWAVETLMGPDAGVWASAVRARTKQLIDGQTGDLGDTRKTFVSGLNFPRKVTQALRQSLDQGRKVSLISGAPLIGKTHVLRELAEIYKDGDEYAVFMIRESGSAGLFQRIANVLSAAIEWSIEPNDVRQWLRRLSNFGGGPALVLAIDGLRPGSAMASDLEEFAELGFGPRLRFVATTDDAETLLTATHGRDASALAAFAEEFEVKVLDDGEFSHAAVALQGRRIALMDGAQFAPEYRLPWVLRAIGASASNSPRYAERDLAAAVLPCLGVEFVERGRTRLTQYAAAQRGYRLLARDLVADVSADSAELSLSRTHTFIVKRDHASAQTRELLPELVRDGWVNLLRHAGGEDIVVPRCPELFVAELGEAFSVALQARMDEDSRAAGHWLGERLDSFFMGDLIGAYAIVRMGLRTGTFSSGVIEGLLEIHPREQALGPGVIGIETQDGSIQNFRVTEDGRIFEADSQGNPIGDALHTDGDLGSTRGNLAGWMILAQLARVPSAAQNDQRVDLGILLEIGIYPFPLLRFHAGMMTGHLVHDIPGHGEILCGESGIAEPLTAHILHVLAGEWQTMDDWIDEAISRNSLHLLSRTRLALSMVSALEGDERAEWARETLREKVNPALDRLLDEAKRDAPEPAGA